jgi:predicted aspartyl protease
MTNPVIDAWTEAVGGRPTIDRARTIYTRSRLKGLGLEGTLEEWATADGDYRQAMDLAGVFKTCKIFSRRERTAWLIDQNGKLQTLTGETLKDHLTDVYFATLSHLATDRLPGACRTKEASDAEDYDVVEVEPEGGASVTYYLDRETHLPVRSEQPTADLTRVTKFDDWQEIDGIKMPFYVRQYTGDPRSEMETIIEEVRINSSFENDLFEKPIETRSDFRFLNGSTTIGIPIELNWNHIFVKTQVNDSKPLWFLLDTGAQLTAIDERVAEELDIECVGEFQGRGAGEGTTTAHLAKGVSFRLPGIEVVDQTVGVIGLADLVNPFTGRPIHGVLGYDFISRFVVGIDYVNKRIDLHDVQAFNYTGDGEELPISLNNGIPTVRATIKPFGSAAFETDFIVDTGASDALYLTRPFVEANNLLDTLIENVRMTVPGVGGESMQNVGRVEQLTIGRHVIMNPVTFFAHARSGAFANPDFAGVIGAEILRRFYVYFDYSNHRMILEPNARFGESYEFDKSGIILQAEGSRLRTYRIRSIIEQSPAEEADVRVGDILVEVDGKATEELTLAELTAILYRNGRALPMRIQRGDELIDVDIQLRRLV